MITQTQPSCRATVIWQNAVIHITSFNLLNVTYSVLSNDGRETISNNMSLVGQTEYKYANLFLPMVAEWPVSGDEVQKYLS